MNTAKQLESPEVIVERAIFGLLAKLPYYGCLVQSFKLAITSQVSTASVRFDSNGESIVLSVNPDWFCYKLSPSEQIAILIHEASHVDRLHLIRVPQATTNWKLANVAADIAINPYIQGLPEGGLFPKDYRLKNYQTFEFYLARLTDDKGEAKASAQSNQSDDLEPSDSGESGDSQSSPGNSSAASASPAKKFIGENAESIDIHDWDNSGLSTAEQAEIIENTMKRAIEKLGLEAGTLPNHVQESLNLLKELKVKQWHKETKRFLGRTVNGFEIEKTWSRRNRRYGFNEAGSKITGQKRLVIAWDTSASVSQKELLQCFAETMAMVKAGVEVTLMQFDTQVNSIQKVKRSTEAVKIEGRGGTNFVDLFEKIDAMKADGLILFTDGADRGAKAVEPKTPVLWVYTDNEVKTNYDWGFKTTLETKR